MLRRKHRSTRVDLATAAGDRIGIGDYLGLLLFAAGYALRREGTSS